MPAALILRLARTSRWAIVASPTRNARAISGVDRPPSVRNVSATCASVANAGWQQVNSSSKRSSPIVASVMSPITSSSEEAGTSSSRVLSASTRSRRMRSMARRRAVVTNHATGSDGSPSTGQRSAAIAKASCAASSARSTSPRKPISAARTRPHCSRKVCSRIARPQSSGRISTPPPMRAAGILAASSIAASRSSASRKQ